MVSLLPSRFAFNDAAHFSTERLQFSENAIENIDTHICVLNKISVFIINFWRKVHQAPRKEIGFLGQPPNEAFSGNFTILI